MENLEMYVASRAKTYSGANDMRGIAFHETANRARGADAMAHAKLQLNGNVRNASWHAQVDDRRVIRSFPAHIRCWHAGDGRTNGGGNYAYYAIEVCVNEGSDLVQAWKNAAEHARQIRAEHPGKFLDLKQHNAFSGKNCPTLLRSGQLGITWDDVLGWVRSTDTPAPAPTPTPAPTPAPTPEKDDIMSKLPTLDWRKQSHQFDPMTRRIQSLLKADGNYPGALDGSRGPQSLAGLASFQREYRCGGANGTADYWVGPKTWQSLLFGTRF